MTPTRPSRGDTVMKSEVDAHAARGAPAGLGARAASRARWRHAARLLALGLFFTAGPGEADVPTVADSAACNEEARQGYRSPWISPTSKDETGAAAARQSRGDTGSAPGAREHVTHSADPQLHGMDGEGAKDAAYRAAYRICMRRRGF